MRGSTLASVLVAALSFLGKTESKAAFAHYMLGGVTQEHAHQDIDDAIALGLDGFALNVGDPTQQFVRDALSSLFPYAANKNFKLFVSMDVAASGGACSAGRASCNGPFDYKWIWDAYKNSPAYYQVNGKPLISTFSSGGIAADKWSAWKASLGNDLFFMPDFDDTSGYYASSDGWWSYWGSLVDGVFSWESAWPLPEKPGAGSLYPGDVTRDIVVLDAAKAHNKAYMMGISTLQYKDAYGASYYREGDLNLPTRMANILSMERGPDFVEMITWNDGPEAHYIGNIWPEANSDAQPWAYANQEDWSHTGWQPLISSFITAYKSGKNQSDMAPPAGTIAVGAMWYQTILTSSVTCPTPKPSGFGDGHDSVYWAAVLSPSAVSGYKLNIISNSTVVATVPLHGGLNQGQSPSAMSPGAQRVELLDPAGTVVISASGGLCVSGGCPDGNYNLNYQVIPMVNGTGKSMSCNSNRHNPDGSIKTTQ